VFGCLKVEENRHKKRQQFRVYELMKVVDPRDTTLDGVQSGIKWWAKSWNKILVGGGEGVPPPLCLKKWFWWSYINKTKEKWIIYVEPKRLGAACMLLLVISCERTNNGVRPLLP